MVLGPDLSAHSSGTVRQNETVLIVDGANVVGSRPDGWWRDRAGAARGLHERLVRAVSSGAVDAPAVLVLEGAARRGVAEGTHDQVQVVHASGSGDDAIVALVNDAALADTTAVTVVTADRELRQRVSVAGATCVGPRWLLDRIDPPLS
jgi:predicted RNA-binding protein with PIN domain